MMDNQDFQDRKERPDGLVPRVPQALWVLLV